MSDRQPITDPSEEEAAAWFARLNSRTVSRQSLADFRTWRQDAENARAYARIETMWGQAGGLEHDPDIAAAIRLASRRRSWRQTLAAVWAGLRRRPALGLGLALAAGVVLTVGFQVSAGQAYETGVGEQRLVRLADGTRIRLDTDSKVRVRLTGRARLVRLVRGQALFEVAHDPARAFVVSADGTDVRALGTRFEVRRLSGGAEVTLIEGRVEVRGGGGATKVWSLKAGQQVTTGVAARPPRMVDVATTTSWTTGRLVFRDLPLSAAIAEVNRYSPRKIELDSERLGETSVNGVFDSGDTEAFLAAVTALHDLERSSGPGGAIILRDKAPG